MISNCMVSDMVIANCPQYENESKKGTLKDKEKM